MNLILQENVNVQQVKQNTDMDSHEEKLHDVIIKSKIEDTKAVMKAKAREIEASKMERLQVITACGPSCCIASVLSLHKQIAHDLGFGQALPLSLLAVLHPP